MLTVPLLAAALATNALAAPSNQARAAGVIALPLSSRNYHQQENALERRDTTGSSGLSIYSRVYHSATIEIGTPPQSVLVGVQANANSFLIMNEGGGNATWRNLPKPTEYNPGNSTTFKTTNRSFMTPNKASLPGRIDSDFVSIGGLSFPDLPFVGTNSSSPADMRGAKNQSGILSLGFDAEAGPGDPFGDPLWKRVVAQGGAPQAGIYFERATHEYEDIKSPFNLDTTHQDNSGELMLGGINSKYYQGDINYLNITDMPSGSFAVHLDGFKVDGEPVPATEETITSWEPAPGGGNISFAANVPGPITIGMGLLNNLGNKTFHALHAEIPGATPAALGLLKDKIPYSVQYMNVPCDTNVTLSLTFNGIDYHLRPQDWIANASHTGLYNNCTSMFYSAEIMPPYLGISFLQSVYTVFQYDTKQLGFAHLVDGLPTRNVSANGTSYVDVPVPTVTGFPTASPSSAADTLHPTSLAAVLAALTLSALSSLDV